MYHLMNRDKKFHIVCVSSIVVITVAGFWLFGLADKVFMGGIFEINEEIDFTTVPPTKNDKENSPASTVQKEQPTIEALLVEREQEIISDDVFIPEPEVEEEEEDEIKSRIRLLEKREFSLIGSGTAYEVSPQVSYDFGMSLTLKPIEGTKLTKFDVINGRIHLAEVGFQLEAGLAEISGTDITIIFERGRLPPPYNMTGTIDEPILQDYDDEQKVSFAKQLLYLSQEDTTPYHISLEGTLSSQ